MGKLLDEGLQKQVREVFEDLLNPVAILFFNRKENCDYCADTQALLEEVVALSDRLSLEVFDIDENADIAKQYHVDKAPGYSIVGNDGGGYIDYGVRFAGIPSGHEFTSLINDLLLVSKGVSGLNEQTREFLAGLSEPVLLQVFVTPT